LVAACVWSCLNDDEGRLWRWTDHKYGKVPAAIQKGLDEQAANAASKPADATKPLVDAVKPAVETAPAAAPKP